MAKAIILALIGNLPLFYSMLLFVWLIGLVNALIAGLLKIKLNRKSSNTVSRERLVFWPEIRCITGKF